MQPVHVLERVFLSHFARFLRQIGATYVPNEQGISCEDGKVFTVLYGTLVIVPDVTITA